MRPERSDALRAPAAWIRALVLLAIAVGVPDRAIAGGAAGATLRLENITLSSGAATRLEGTSRAAGVTIGQGTPIGEMEGSSVRLESGFWPATAPEPDGSVLAIAALAALGRRSARRRVVESRPLRILPSRCSAHLEGLLQLIGTS